MACLGFASPPPTMSTSGALAFLLRSWQPSTLPASRSHVAARLRGFSASKRTEAGAVYGSNEVSVSAGFVAAASGVAGALVSCAAAARRRRCRALRPPRPSFGTPEPFSPGAAGTIDAGLRAACSSGPSVACWAVSKKWEFVDDELTESKNVHVEAAYVEELAASSSSTHKWKCVEGCGACCYLAPQDRPYLSELLSPEELGIFRDLVQPDGWCKNFDHEKRNCKIYEERPIFCRTKTWLSSKAEGFGVNASDPEEVDSFCAACCRESIGDVYGETSEEMERYNEEVTIGLDYDINDDGEDEEGDSEFEAGEFEELTEGNMGSWEDSESLEDEELAASNMGNWDEDWQDDQEEEHYITRKSQGRVFVDFTFCPDGDPSEPCEEGASEKKSSGRPRSLTVANCGDSRALLCRAGKVVELSEDHKPELESEELRIRKAGGCVKMIGPCHRIDGWGLNLSRALGDFHYKARADLPVDQQKVIAVPEIRTLQLNDEDEFLVLGCDGCFELHTSQNVIDIVRKALQSGMTLQQAAEELVDRSCSPNLMKTRGKGGDNCSCIIIRLPK
ncbi:unnamed protein product [Polarella glacialis]|uniref:protein-serine/threonine phosphatase n=1 Tax=Polarella glacialis TaxID=89957 RepID=A0A813HAB6_POLGL|nr:unnamed protein product [Polarella glacialis]